MSDKIAIRPSSIDTLFGCAHQWYRVFILGQTSITNNRAAIGTAIHKGAEVLWKDAMQTRKKDANIPKLVDASLEAFKEEDKHGISYGDGEDINTSNSEIIKGVEAFVDDIVPFTSIPDGVEERFTVGIADHPIVKAISGTVDYIETDTIADIKTSKRKPTPASYETQQSIYKLLAVEGGGRTVNHNLIQGVVLKKVPEGTILNAPVNLSKARYLVNHILDTLEVLHSDVVDPNILFRGNPKHVFCSPKFCAFYGTCKFVQGAAPEATNVSKPKL